MCAFRRHERHVRVLEGHSSHVDAVAVNRAGRLIVRSGSELTVLDVQTGTAIAHRRIEAKIDPRDVVIVSPSLEWSFVRSYMGVTRLVPLRVAE